MFIQFFWNKASEFHISDQNNFPCFWSFLTATFQAVPFRGWIWWSCAALTAAFCFFFFSFQHYIWTPCLLFLLIFCLFCFIPAQRKGSNEVSSTSECANSSGLPQTETGMFMKWRICFCVPPIMHIIRRTDLELYIDKIIWSQPNHLYQLSGRHAGLGLYRAWTYKQDNSCLKISITLSIKSNWIPEYGSSWLDFFFFKTVFFF